MGKKVDPRYFRLYEMQPRKGDLRRIEIILASIRLIAKTGLTDLSLDSVAKSLEVRRSHVAYYFATKRELLDAVVKLVIATGQDIVVESVRSAESAEAGIRKHIEGHYLWLTKYPEHAPVMLMFYFLASHDTFFCNLNKEVFRKGRERIQGMLDQLPKVKSLPAPARALLADQYQRVLAGNLVAFFTGAAEATWEQSLTQTTEAIFRLLKQQAKKGA
jgi:AcrR family transcriptional regulator